MLAVGCGGQNGPGGGGSGGSIAEEFDFSGPQDSTRFTVGSKDFTEQRVLGEIAIQALEAAGADVTDRIGIGGNEAVRQALTNDDINMYWEYTATGWLVHLGNPDPHLGPSGAVPGRRGRRPRTEQHRVVGTGPRQQHLRHRR